MVLLPDIALSSNINDDLQCWEGSFNEEFGRSNRLRYAADQLSKSITKKFIPATTGDQDSAAIQLFRSMNERNCSVTLNPEFGLLDHLRRQFSLLAYGFGEDFSLENLTGYWKLGPGASIGTRHTSLFGKLSKSVVTYENHTQLAFFKACTSLTPLGALTENIRQKRYGVKKVTASKMTCVPKDEKISRLVCTEPLAAMCLQMSIGRLIERKLNKIYHIDLSTQPAVNKALARKGSIDQSYGTIDLKSASDCISLRLMDLILDPYMLLLLSEARSPAVNIAGEIVPLDMISTMGNGFTFPLQTFLFATVVDYNLRKHNIKATPQVFGDDIVVPSSIYEAVCLDLTSLGFIVNVAKSFNTGPFRESCGGDYYEGYDVRGVYIKRLDHPAFVSLAYNLLSRWSLRHGIPLSKTLKWLREMVPKRFTVPIWESDTAGIKDTLISSGYDYNLQAPRYKYSRYFVKRVLERPRREQLPAWLWTMLNGNSSQPRSIRVRDNKRVIGEQRVWTTVLA